MRIKDDVAIASLRRAASITHKVLKHGIVRLVERAFDECKEVTHEDLAAKAEEMCEDPSKLKISVPPGQLESCYFPIIQVLSPPSYYFIISFLNIFSEWWRVRSKSKRSDE